MIRWIKSHPAACRLMLTCVHGPVTRVGVVDGVQGLVAQLTFHLLTLLWKRGGEHGRRKRKRGGQDCSGKPRGLMWTRPFSWKADGRHGKTRAVVPFAIHMASVKDLRSLTSMPWDRLVAPNVRAES